MNEPTKTAAARLLDLLDKVKPTGANKWMACCPSHDDKNPSLAITQLPGRALAFCHAGCETADVVATLNLTMADLWDTPRERDYVYDNRHTIHRKYQPDGSKTFTASNAGQPWELFKLSVVKAAVAEGRDIYLCEGEEDVRAVESLGVTATTSPHGANNWAKTDHSPLIGGSDVYVVADLDKGGLKRGADLAEYLPSIGVNFAGVLTAKTGNDAADHIAAGCGLTDFVPFTVEAPDPPALGGYAHEHYANVGDLLDRGEIAPPAPTVGRRNDGAGLFYRDQVNTIFGNPESGKTLIAQCALVDELNRGNNGLIIDLDHNGAAATISRLIAMGADDVILRNPDRFRYAAPDDAEQVLAIVADTLAWKPSVVLLDSLGELMPIFGASSNDADDFTRVYGAVLKPLAKSGAAVIVVDHLAKNPGSQAFGSTGTAAKKRAIGGTSLRVTVTEAFRPGHGGKAQLTINKDRHGGLRAVSGGDDREPLAATFRLWDENGDIRWNFHPPEQGERAVVEGISEDDIKALAEMEPAPTSQRNVKDRLGWGSTRALDALREWRRRGEPTSVLPCSSLGVSGAEEQSEPLQERSGSIKERYSNTAPRSLHQGVGAEEHSNGGAS